MSKTLSALGERVWEMPPLILHLFHQRVPADSLLENSRAALMLSGLIPSDGSGREELRRRILAGRLGEINGGSPPSHHRPGELLLRLVRLGRVFEDSGVAVGRGIAVKR